MDIIATKFPVSARLGGMAVVLALCVGGAAGCSGCIQERHILSIVYSCLPPAGIAVPGFVICTLLLYVFGVKLQWLPTLGLKSAAELHYAGGCAGSLSDIIYHASDAVHPCWMFSEALYAYSEAKGLSQKVSLFKHALRNAILPVITYVGPMLAYTLTGSFVTEKIFTIPGLGGEFIKAINGRDYTMIMGTTIFLATIMIVMNVIVDIVYKLVDPRIKLK